MGGVFACLLARRGVRKEAPLGDEVMKRRVLIELGYIVVLAAGGPD